MPEQNAPLKSQLEEIAIRAAMWKATSQDYTVVLCLPDRVYGSWRTRVAGMSNSPPLRCFSQFAGLVNGAYQQAKHVTTLCEDVKFGAEVPHQDQIDVWHAAARVASLADHAERFRGHPNVKQCPLGPSSEYLAGIDPVILGQEIEKRTPNAERARVIWAILEDMMPSALAAHRPTN